MNNTSPKFILIGDEKVSWLINPERIGAVSLDDGGLVVHLLGGQRIIVSGEQRLTEWNRLSALLTGTEL